MWHEIPITLSSCVGKGGEKTIHTLLYRCMYAVMHAQDEHLTGPYALDKDSLLRPAQLL